MIPFHRRLLALVPAGLQLSVLAIPTTGEPWSTRVAADDPAAFARAVERAASSSGEPGVYAGVCPLRADAARGGRGKKRDLACAPALWVDVDVAAPEGVHAAEALPPTFDDALDLVLGAVPLEPSMVVDSGFGLHAYWVLDRPLEFGEGGASSPAGERFERALRALQDRVRVAGAVKGWHVDRVADATRVLRVPGTTNQKHASRPPCRVVDSAGPNHSFEVVEDAVGARSADAAAVPLPAARAVHPPAASSTTSSTTANVVDELRAAPRGERDAAMQRAASRLAFRYGRDFPAEMLVEVMRPALEAWASEDGATTPLEVELGKALDKATRALGDRDGAERRRRSVAERLRARSPQPGQPTDQVSGETRAPSNHGPSVPAGGEDAATGAAQPIALAIGDHGYFLDGGEYHGPFSGLGLSTAYGVHVPEDMRYRVGAEGQQVRVPVRDHFQAHGRPIAAVHASGDVERACFDPATGILTEACWRRRPVSPARDERVDAWLRLLGGDQAEKLLDWVACAYRTDRQLCGLVLVGEKDVGKNLLAQGIGARYVAGAVPGHAAFDGFDEDLLGSPIVFADEELPAGLRSTRLRAFLGDAEHTVKGKYKPNRRLRGCFRLVLAANDDGILRFEGERFGGHDVEAVAGRFFVVRCEGVAAEAARAFLERVKAEDPEALDRWRGRAGEQPTIAAHALWLRDHRAVVPGRRFLVDGGGYDVALQLVSRNQGGDLVTEWLARAVEALSGGVVDPQVRRTLRTDDRIMVGDGRVLVAASLVEQRWGLLMRAGKEPPRSRSVVAALKGVSRGVARPRVDGGRLRLHDVHLEAIRGAAVDLDLDWEAMEAAIARSPSTLVDLGTNDAANGARS